MMRIEGVPVVAERLQKALRPARQADPFHGAMTADTSALDEFQSGVDMDFGASIQEPIEA
jgi:hypothetical protein